MSRKIFADLITIFRCGIILVVMLLFFSTASFAEENGQAQISAIFVDITHLTIISAENPDTRLVPASTSKLFITAATLKQWGSGHIFTTPVYQRGTMHQGILQGDLILYGVGDPTLTNEKLWQLVNNLQQVGLKKVRGDIVVNNSFLGQVAVNDPDRAKAKTYAEEGYDGLLSSAGSNFATVGVSVVPAKKVGEQAKLFILPFKLSNVVLTGQVITRNAASQPIKLTRETRGDKEILHISGEISINSKTIILYRSVGNPDLTTAALLKIFLRQADIPVTGKIRVESTPIKATDTVLTSVASDPLGEILREMLWFSNNYIADMLTLDLWREQQKAAISPILLSNATKPLVDMYKTMQSYSVFGTDLRTPPILDSGSGLTPSNRIAAQDFAILLAAMYQDQRDFPVFYGDLTIPGMQPLWHGISSKDHPWFNRTAIKTGSMKTPTAVCSMAGYFRMKNGDLGAFALLLNQPGLTPDKMMPILLSKLDTFFENH